MLDHISMLDHTLDHMLSHILDHVRMVDYTLDHTLDNVRPHFRPHVRPCYLDTLFALRLLMWLNGQGPNEEICRVKVGRTAVTLAVGEIQLITYLHVK